MSYKKCDVITFGDILKQCDLDNIVDYTTGELPFINMKNKLYKSYYNMQNQIVDAKIDLFKNLNSFKL